jgi:hypothetical protein
MSKKMPLFLKKTAYVIAVSFAWITCLPWLTQNGKALHTTKESEPQRPQTAPSINHGSAESKSADLIFEQLAKRIDSQKPIYHKIGC